MKWETMTFNVFQMGTEDSVRRAFDVLRDGGVVIEAIHELLWNNYCAAVIDKYGVCWWIAIQRAKHCSLCAKECNNFRLTENIR